MNIVIYTHPFPPMVGGAEKYVLLLAQGLMTAKVPGVQVTVVTPTPKGSLDDSGFGFRVVRRPTLYALGRLLAKADIVQLAGPCLLPLFIAWLLRRHVVIEHHGYSAVCPNGLLFYEPSKTVCPGHFVARRHRLCLLCNNPNDGNFKSLAKLITTFPRRWLCQRSDANIAITQHVLRRLDLNRSRVIYYGIPEEPAEDPQNSHPISISIGSGFCFAYVGRFVTLKGLHLILHAAHNLRAAGYRFRVKFVGDGPLRRELEALTEMLGLSDCIHFTGFLLGAELGEALQDVSTVLMPSVWEETAGLAAIEQMMRGRLVIASDIGGLGEVVGDAGLRFPADSLEGLIACMKKVLDQPEIIRSKGHSARQRAQSMFLQERMVKEHLELYSRLVRLGKRSLTKV